MLRPIAIASLMIAAAAVPLSSALAQNRTNQAETPPQIKVIGKPTPECGEGQPCTDEAETKRIRAALALMYLGIRRDCGAGSCAIKLTTGQR